VALAAGKGSKWQAAQGRWGGWHIAGRTSSRTALYKWQRLREFSTTTRADGTHFRFRRGDTAGRPWAVPTVGRGERHQPQDRIRSEAGPLRPMRRSRRAGISGEPPPLRTGATRARSPGPTLVVAGSSAHSRHRDGEEVSSRVMPISSAWLAKARLTGWGAAATLGDGSMVWTGVDGDEPGREVNLAHGRDGRSRAAIEQPVGTESRRGSVSCVPAWFGCAPWFAPQRACRRAITAARCGES
jgi:hypothetical protein